MDGRVLDAPYPIRFFVVHCCILPSRPRQSAEAYHKIWLPEGSPLIVTSARLRAAVQEWVDVPVELAMRYQNPSISHAIQRLDRLGVTDLLVIPLFPHYAMSSFETAAERVKEVARRLAPEMSLQVAEPYYNDPDYIDALVASSAEYLAGDYHHLLFSFHGIPERHLHKSDPTGRHCLRTTNCCSSGNPAHRTCYRAHCFETVRAFVARAGIRNYSVAFQSRLGKEPWLRPYTDAELVRLGHAGVKKLLVICPAFVADCLETIEEIGIRGKETFLAAGGHELKLIPCLNVHAAWVKALAKMIERGCESAVSAIPLSPFLKVGNRPVAAI
jgi:ferrochelatase